MIIDPIEHLRELKRQGAKLTPLQRIVLDAFYTHDPDALEAAEELELLTRYKKALESLTPGGSEFSNDPERCAADIRERTNYPKQIIELRAELAALKEQK